jgi:hypothetical protein
LTRVRSMAPGPLPIYNRMPANVSRQQLRQDAISVVSFAPQAARKGEYLLKIPARSADLQHVRRPVRYITGEEKWDIPPHDR